MQIRNSLVDQYLRVFPTQASKTSAKYISHRAWKNLFIFAVIDWQCLPIATALIGGKKKLFAIAAWGDRSKCGKGLCYPVSLACTFDECAFLVNSKSRAHWECLHNDSCGVKFAAVLKCMGIMVIGKLHKVTHAVVSSDTRNGRRELLDIDLMSQLGTAEPLIDSWCLTMLSFESKIVAL